MRIILLLLVALFLIGSPPVKAQSVDVEALKKKIAERSGQYAELVTVLEDRNPDVALAAFDVMVESGNKSLLEMAISSALSATDTRLRARALWEAVSRRDNLVTEVNTAAIENREEALAALSDWHGAQQSWPLYERFPDTQCINLWPSPRQCHKYQVTVSGIKLDMSYSGKISGSFVLQPNGELVGTIQDPSQPDSVYPARIVFR